MGNGTIFFFLFLAFVCIEEGFSDKAMREACATKETCAECIQTSGCQWCSAPLDETKVRCRHGSEFVENSRDDWCPADDVDNPIMSAVIEKDDQIGEYGTHTVQIKPQEVTLKLRVDEVYDLKFQYKRAEDHPVDLYYLMDLSGSMADDKENLAKLGNKLAKTMRGITKNFKIGFGSFVDKVEAPYVSTAPKKISKPCEDKQNCSAPYSFKNQMPLSSDHAQFSIRVRAAEISGNLDSPEGGFDALMQAIVCNKEIGWRPDARHLLVFSTDASFHLAGDGKLAGIILPNDAQCHLVGDEYEKAASLKYDYPSISQLNQKAQENNINLIFAVTSRHSQLYMLLRDRIKGASFGTLDGDSSNVIELVRSEYEKLRGSVTLDYSDADNQHVEVKFLSTCVNEPERETKECRNLEFHHVVNFTAKIRAYKCPDNPGQMIPLEIKLLALNESLKVNVEVLCSCSCENKNFEVNSAKCSRGGNLTCGVCTCDAEHVGRTCECRRDAVDSANDNSKCIKDNILCSGLGVCKCGVCQCNQRNSQTEKYYGKFCECDNFSCDRKGSLLCSGPMQGDCKCGKCVCKPGWSGKACDCRESIDECSQTTADGSKVICSNQGFCKCGVCKCNVTENERYSGKYCGECPTCPVDQRCEELKICVDCKAYNAKHEDCGKCLTHNVTKLETLRDVDTSKGEHRCLALVDSCRLEFIYKYVEGSPTYIEALLEKDCTISGNVLAIILGVTGGTVLLGLLILIIWKVLTSIHDRREYVKFEKERALAKWDRGDNPLYKPSTQTFNNPTFGNN